MLLSWNYNNISTIDKGEKLVPVQFLVQCKHDGKKFVNSSDLLNSTEYQFDQLWWASSYQFQVLAYRSGVFSVPSSPTYTFINGITGIYTYTVYYLQLVLEVEVSGTAKLSDGPVSQLKNCPGYQIVLCPN